MDDALREAALRHATENSDNLEVALAIINAQEDLKRFCIEPFVNALCDLFDDLAEELGGDWEANTSNWRAHPCEKWKPISLYQRSWQGRFFVSIENGNANGRIDFGIRLSDNRDHITKSQKSRLNSLMAEHFQTRVRKSTWWPAYFSLAQLLPELNFGSDELFTYSSDGVLKLYNLNLSEKDRRDSFKETLKQRIKPFAEKISIQEENECTI